MKLTPIEKWEEVARGFESIKNSDTRSKATRLAEAISQFDKGGMLPDVQLMIDLGNCSGSTGPTAACEAVGLLSPHSDSPLEYVMKFYAGVKSPARCWMMRFYEGPPELLKEVVLRGLKDKSRRVREWACEGAGRLSGVDFCVHLKEFASDPRNREFIELANRAQLLIEQGYYAFPCDDGDWEFFVRLGYSSWYGWFESGEDVQQIGVAELVKRTQDSWRNTLGY